MDHEVAWRSAIAEFEALRDEMNVEFGRNRLDGVETAAARRVVHAGATMPLGVMYETERRMGGPGPTDPLRLRPPHPNQMDDADWDGIIYLAELGASFDDDGCDRAAREENTPRDAAVMASYRKLREILPERIAMNYAEAWRSVVAELERHKHDMERLFETKARDGLEITDKDRAVHAAAATPLSAMRAIEIRMGGDSPVEAGGPTPRHLNQMAKTDWDNVIHLAGLGANDDGGGCDRAPRDETEPRDVAAMASYRKLKGILGW